MTLVANPQGPSNAVPDPSARQIFVKRLWADKEIAGRMYLQLVHLFPQPLLQDQKDRFLKHAFAAMHKLTAMKYHVDNYERIEEEQYKESLEIFQKSQTERREAFELIFELEAFLFQMKSSLDMLVKLLIPAIGPGLVKTHTYENAGNSLLKGLRQYAKGKKANKQAVEHLCYVIEVHRDGWLEKAVALRDEINHIQGVNNYHFSPLTLSDGKVDAERPRFKGIETLEFIRLIYHNALVFHQDFMVYTLALKSPPVFVLAPQDPKSAEEMFPGYGQYIRFCWVLNTPTEQSQTT
jgi:hypothetical protein